MLCALGVVGALVLSWRQGETRVLTRRLVTAVYVALYLVVEFHFNGGEFVLMPVVRFVAGWPSRIGHWFTDPARFGVPLEILFIALVVWIVAHRVRRVYARRSGRAMVRG